MSFPQFGCCCWAVQSKMVCLFGGEVNTNYYKLFPGHPHLMLLGRVRWWWTDGSQDAVVDGPCDCSQLSDSTTKTELLGWWVYLFQEGPGLYNSIMQTCCWFPSTTTSSNLTTHFVPAGAHLPLGCKGGRSTDTTLWWTNSLLWKITIFNGKIHYKWPFSIAMLVHQRVYPINIPLNHYKIPLNHYKSHIWSAQWWGRDPPHPWTPRKPHFGNAPRLTAHLAVIAPEPLRSGGAGRWKHIVLACFSCNTVQDDVWDP